jgi:hypothetical protein
MGWTGAVPRLQVALGKLCPKRTPTVLDSPFDTTKGGQRASDWNNHGTEDTMLLQ